MEIELRSGKYIGNGTTQDILFSTNWKKLTIVSTDRKYIMTYFKDNESKTIGQAAIGNGGTYKQLEAVEGGVTIRLDGFTVGNHISINETGTEYFWSVV